MTRPAFPTLPSGARPDSKQFTEDIEDPTLRTDIEGGYVVTRAKHTRRPRRTWGVAYQQLTNADKQAIDDFLDAVKVGSVIFDWLNPQNSVVYSVRFAEGGVKWKYVGIGPTQRWDCSFAVQQA